MKKYRSPRIVIALVLAVVFLTAAQARASGYYYEFVGTNQGQKKKQTDETHVKGWVDGDKTRVEFSSGDKKGFFADGNYLVTTDGGETVYLINNKDKTYAEFDMEQLMAMMGQAMAMMEQMGGMFKMEFNNVHNEKLLEEPGESILGRSTTHYRYNSGYTMSMKMMGMKQETTIDSVQDLWCTDDFDGRGFGVWLRPDRNMKTGNEEFDKLINTEMAKIKGFPLRTVTTSTTTNKKGKSTEQTFTNEVTVLREESIADSTFEWPSDYTETQIIPEMQGMEGYDQQAGKKDKKKKKSGLSSVFDKPDDDG